MTGSEATSEGSEHSELPTHFIRQTNSPYSPFRSSPNLAHRSPEPEIIYVSDGRLPSKVSKTMVNEELEQIVTEGEGSLFDEADEGASMRESRREMYWKYRGEQSLINSGLAYSIVRVLGYDETPSVTERLVCKKMREGIGKVTRKDVAEVRMDEEQRLERSDSKSNIPPSYLRPTAFLNN